MQLQRSEHPWIQNSIFRPDSQAAVLRQVIEIVANFSNKGARPVVVFDLDSTLFDVRYRTLAILKQWSRSPSGLAWGDLVQDRLRSFRVMDVHYSLRDTLRPLQAHVPAAKYQDLLADLTPYWRRRFFHDYGLTWDRPTLGAQSYVHAVVAAGAEALYLTGRDVESMERGTWSVLRHWGFPTGKSVALGMKPRRQLDDGAFKRGYLTELAASKPVLAVFDNEPANFPHFYAANSSSMLVFIHSQCSDREAEPGKGLYRIFDFRLLHSAKD